MLRQGAANTAYVKAALIKSFHDLDADYVAQHPENQDGCGATVALLVGEHLFVAVLGRCAAVVAEAEGGSFKPMQLNLGGQTAAAGSLGQPALKAEGGNATPEVRGIALKGSETHPFMLLSASTVAARLKVDQIVEFASDFSGQPRLACSEILERVLQMGGTQPNEHLLVAQVSFMSDRKAAEKGKEMQIGPQKVGPKKAKIDSMRSIRLRHILMTHQDPSKVGSTKTKITRTKVEAEAMLRKASKGLRQELKDSKKTPKTATELVIMQGKKFNECCKELSECPSAKKGGAMCGDLGWLSMEELARMGGNLREKVDPLLPGQWSDVCTSDQGVHLIQRVA